MEHEKSSPQACLRGIPRAVSCTHPLWLVLVGPCWRCPKAHPCPGFMVPSYDHAVDNARRCALARDRGYPVPTRRLLDHRRPTDGSATAAIRIAVEDGSASIS